MLIRVPDDEPCRSEDQDGDMASQLVTVEGRLVMDDVRDERLTCEGGLEGIGDEVGVVATPLDVTAEAVTQGARIRHGAYPPIPGGAR